MTSTKKVLTFIRFNGDYRIESDNDKEIFDERYYKAGFSELEGA